MRVHPDFYLYKSGVYRYSGLGAQQRSGYHSVRILGWGVDSTQQPPLKYWVLSSSIPKKNLTFNRNRFVWGTVGGQFVGEALGRGRSLPHPARTQRERH